MAMVSGGAPACRRVRSVLTHPRVDKSIDWQPQRGPAASHGGGGCCSGRSMAAPTVARPSPKPSPTSAARVPLLVRWPFDSPLAHPAERTAPTALVLQEAAAWHPLHLRW